MTLGPAGAPLHGHRRRLLRVLDAAHVPQPLRDHVHGARTRLQCRGAAGLPGLGRLHDGHLPRLPCHQQVSINLRDFLEIRPNVVIFG